MTTSLPEENTLGVVIGKAGRAVGNTARRIGRAANAATAHRASLGTSFLGLGAAILVGVRAVYGLIWFAAQWNVYPEPWAALAAWVVLLTVLIVSFIVARVIGDRLPDWMFGLFLAGLAIAVALDIIAIWELHDVGRHATAALAAGMALLLLVTLRGAAEVLTSVAVLGGALAVVVFLDAPAGAVDAEWVAIQLIAVAATVLPPVIGVVLVEHFRRMVQVELDRVLVQSTVSAPRFAVGMLASEELARLDLAAEQLLDSVASKKTSLPLSPRSASVAAQLATELRLHLIEGRRETWLYHAISESEMLGKSVTLIDKSSLAGLLDPRQRDGLLAAVWLLVSDQPATPNPRRRRAARSVTVEVGPVVPGAPAPERKIAIPIVLTTTGVPRNRVDSGVWDALNRVGRYSDSTQDASLRVDIECLVDNPAD